jgi:hypothetical protein
MSLIEKVRSSRQMCFPYVCYMVILHITLLCKSFPTHPARIWLLSSMDTQVLIKMMFLSKCFLTKFTSVFACTSNMLLNMAHQEMFFQKTGIAD